VTAVTLADVADELYGLTPAQFTAARDERAREVRAAGNRDAAAAIKKLARPTASAWLVNQLSRRAPEQMTRLYQVGEALAEAQRTLAGERLRELSGERRQAIGDLIPAAGELAEELGQPASTAVLSEVRSTLEAVLADSGARSAVQSGRLTKALSYAGIGEVDLSAALALPLDSAPGRAAPRRSATGRSAPAREAEPGDDRPGPGRPRPGIRRQPPKDRPAERASQAAEALRAAQADAEESAAALAEADRQLTGIAEQRQFLARRVAHLDRELQQAHAEDSQLIREAKRAQRDRDAAARAAAAAERRLEKARQQDVAG
jgi:hypothetical protein